eukprot:11798745-Alexandrium_andersonii.AAC.1
MPVAARGGEGAPRSRHWAGRALRPVGVCKSLHPMRLAQIHPGPAWCAGTDGQALGACSPS